MVGMANLENGNKTRDYKVPVVNLDRIRNTYDELKKMEVRLDANPIDFGPQRFNNRIAKVRSMLNRVEQIFLQTSEDLHLFKRIINAKRTLYEFAKRELMTRDTGVRVGRSQGEREALADVKLREDLEELAELQEAATDLETLMISIKSKRTDLKDIQGRMRDQMKMIEHDISMGAKWGKNSPLPAAAATPSEINSMLADMDPTYGMDEEEEEDEDDETLDFEETEGDVDLDSPEEAPPQDEEEEAPHAEDPVLVFGEETEETSDQEESAESAEEPLLEPGSNPGELPDDTSTESEVEDFLDVLGTAGDDAEEGFEDEAEEEQQIDDLIASLSDD